MDASMVSSDSKTTARRNICLVLSLVLPLALGPLWLALWSCVPDTGWFSTVGGLDLLWVLIAATVIDIRYLTIPNWVTYPALTWAVLANAMWSTGIVSDPMLTDRWPLNASMYLGAIGIAESISGMLVCFFALFWNYAIVRRGAGDVKLASVIGAWLGVKCGVSAIVFGLLLAASIVLSVALWRFGAVSVVCYLIQKMMRPVVGSGQVNKEIEAWFRRPTPIAAALAAGTLLVFVCGNLFD